jgi:hypothetical protein
VANALMPCGRRMAVSENHVKLRTCGSSSSSSSPCQCTLKGRATAAASPPDICHGNLHHL